MTTANDGPMMTLDRLDVLMRAVLEDLAGRPDGTAAGRDVLAAVARRVALSPVELEANASGIPRWETNVRFHTTDCGRADFMRKQKGQWSITEAGRAALALPPGKLIREAKRLYKIWRGQQSPSDADVAKESDEQTDTQVAPSDTQLRKAAFDRAEEDARRSIQDHVAKLGPYELQDLTEYLLVAMGYFVAFNASPGPDGGVDLIVYKDPLGTVTPRIKVQVKHRPTDKVSVKEVRELQGLLQHQEEVGLLVSTGGFTGEAARAARSAGKHVDMIDLTRLVELWVKHYDRIDPEGRAMLPIAPIYFLAPSEE